MANLIDLPSAPSKPPAQIIAEHMLHALNATLAERVNDHKVFFRKFWDSHETPDAILAEMGEYAPVLLAAAGENLNHIGRLAGIVGKTLFDFLTPSEYEPKRAFVIAANGITLAPPADGYDAWGSLIPIPEPEPEIPAE